MTKREFLDTVFALAPNEANAIMDAFDEYVDSNEPHWIPVTERLPEKSGRYFVTERIYHINDKEHTGGFILKTDFAEYSATEKKWRRAQALVVVAWMDNEPYKGVTIPPECEGDCGWCKPSVIEKCKGVTDGRD